MEHFPPPEDDISYISFRDVSWLQVKSWNEDKLLLITHRTL